MPGMRNERIVTLQSAPHGTRRRLVGIERRLSRIEQQMRHIERQMRRIERRARTTTHLADSMRTTRPPP